MTKLKGLFVALVLIFLACAAAAPGCDCDCSAHGSHRPNAIPAAK